MDIKFVWNGSFAGTSHSMIIDGKEIRLGGVVSKKEEAKKEAINILKQNYNIEYDEAIEFEWGGRL